MPPGNFRDYRIAKQLSRMSSAAQRIPALHHNPQFLDKRNHVILLIIWMDLILDQRGDGIHLREKLRQFLHIPIRQSNRTDFPFFHKLFHRFVRLHIIGVWMMQKHQVYFPICFFLCFRPAVCSIRRSFCFLCRFRSICYRDYFSIYDCPAFLSLALPARCHRKHQ